MAAVVGFVLILAASLTYYSWLARSEIPEWGADAEEQWDAAIGDALLRLDHAAGAAIGTEGTVSGALPPAPEPRSLDVPLLAPASPVRPAGAVAFEPRCGGFSATHDVDGRTVTDLASAAQGCLAFRAQSSYSPGYGYRLEHGGLLRLQSDRAAVLSGPPLELRSEAGRYLVTLSVMDLEGPPIGVGADRAAVPILLSPRPGDTESIATNNSAATAWTLRTQHPDTWAGWYDAQLDAAGFDPAGNYACTDAEARCAGLAADEVRIVIGGPSADPAVEDITLSISYGRYDVSLG